MTVAVAIAITDCNFLTLTLDFSPDLIGIEMTGNPVTACYVKIRYLGFNA